jgi:hypothetical protein
LTIFREGRNDRPEKEMEVGATLFVALLVFSWLNVGGMIHF